MYRGVSVKTMSFLSGPVSSNISQDYPEEILDNSSTFVRTTVASFQR